MFQAIRERRFAKRIVRQLLKSYSAIRTRKPELSGQPLYREILIDTGLVDPAQVDEVLAQAEDSIDEWTTHSVEGLGFREVVHFVVLSKFQTTRNVGTVVSFKSIVYSLIPADM